MAYLADTVPFDLAVLRHRYDTEMHRYLGRPEREDLTLKLWMDIIEELAALATDIAAALASRIPLTL